MFVMRPRDISLLSSTYVVPADRTEGGSVWADQCRVCLVTRHPRVRWSGVSKGWCTVTVVGLR